MKWESLTSSEVKELVVSGYTTSILPFGSIEQHGAHLQVNYDYLVSERLADDLSKFISKSFILPTLKLGSASHHLGFFGTLSLKEETVLSILNDLAESLIASGQKTLIILNGHGGNYDLIAKFAKSFKGELKIVHDGEEKYLFKVIKELSDKFTFEQLGLHGGFFETSLAMYTHSESVRTDKYEKENEYLFPDDIKTLLVDGIKAHCPNGIVGNPHGSNAEDGRKFYEILLNYHKEMVSLC